MQRHRLVLAAWLGLSCAPAPTAQPTAPPQPAASSPAPMTDTGVIDEESFKKLHELRGDAAPPARGVEVDVAGSRAYLSLPAGAKAPLPAVIVIHEWWGLNDHIRHFADRVAAEGYAALAVDLYGGQVATDPDSAMKLMKSVDDARSQEILAAAHGFVADDARIDARKRAVIGWCFGGGWSLRHAIAHPDLDAAIIYYGRLTSDEAKLAKIRAELLGVFADRDQGIPPAAVDEFVAALGRAGKTIELHRYDADHAFANPSSARYDEKAAADAWSHVRAFLQRTLR